MQFPYHVFEFCIGAASIAYEFVKNTTMLEDDFCCLIKEFFQELDHQLCMFLVRWCLMMTIGSEVGTDSNSVIYHSAITFLVAGTTGPLLKGHNQVSLRRTD
jgi:hypothetical protein